MQIDLPPFLMHQFWATEPWVVYQSSERLTVPELLPPVPCIRIFRHARGVELPEVIRQVKECQAFRPRDVVLYAAQCDAHFNMLRRLRVPCVRWNHNALINERIFALSDTPPSCHTTISRVVPFKRLELMRGVPDLKIIGGFEDPEYHERLRPLMTQAEFLNEQAGWLDDTDVAAWLQKSHAMLLTSDDTIEGNCRAVTEAMLTGCPVIYTSPQRMCETWLVPETSVAVPPIADFITHAAQYHRKWDKPCIRQRTLENVKKYRADLQEAVEIAARQLGYPGFILDVQALVDAFYVRWLDRDHWIESLPPVIRQQLGQ